MTSSCITFTLALLHHLTYMGLLIAMFALNEITGFKKCPWTSIWGDSGLEICGMMMMLGLIVGEMVWYYISTD